MQNCFGRQETFEDTSKHFFCTFDKTICHKKNFPLEQLVVQDYSKITQLTTVVIERTSFLEFLSGRKFLWEFLWQGLQAASVKGEETSLHCIGVVEFAEYILYTAISQ